MDMKRRKKPGGGDPWWSRPRVLLGAFSLYALIVWGALNLVAHFADPNHPTKPQILKMDPAPRR